MHTSPGSPLKKPRQLPTLERGGTTTHRFHQLLSRYCANVVRKGICRNNRGHQNGTVYERNHLLLCVIFSERGIFYSRESPLYCRATLAYS